MLRIEVELAERDPIEIKKIDIKKDLYQISFGDGDIKIVCSWTQLILINGISNKLIKEELT